MNLKDIFLDNGTRALLEANGEDDGLRGIDMCTGWHEVAELCGFTNGRTPAREAYEDGWYRGAMKRNSNARAS